MHTPMARLPKGVLVTSKPVCTFPNGDYFYVELSRTNGHYDCFVKMARSGDPSKSLVVARAQAMYENDTGELTPEGQTIVSRLEGSMTSARVRLALWF